MTDRRRGIVLALPSKGHLYERSIDFLNSCGLAVRRYGNEREYTAKLVGVEGIEVAFFRADEIPTRVDQGIAHLGITGEDLYRESGIHHQGSYLLIRDLGFGAARLVVAVPRTWIDLTSIEDLVEVATLFRQKHGRSMRVATKFPNLTRAYFADRGIADYRIVESWGATEGAPSSDAADIVIDLTSTGATLSQNYLKEIPGGTILSTQACLIASLRSEIWGQDEARSLLRHFVEQIEARLRAESILLLNFSMAGTVFDKIRRELVSRLNCVIHSSVLSGADDRAEISAYCPKGAAYEVASFLRNNGCANVLVNRAQFLYESESKAFEAFRLALKKYKSAE